MDIKRWVWVILCMIAAAAPVGAQGYDPRRPEQALERVLDVLDLPGTASDWEREAWTYPLPGDAGVAFTRGEWTAYLNAPVVPRPEYAVLLVAAGDPVVWSGSVDGDGVVDGKWLDVEGGILNALNERFGDGDWERLALPFNPASARRAGYPASPVTALYRRKGGPDAAVWYGAEPPYHVALQGEDGSVSVYQVDEDGEWKALTGKDGAFREAAVRAMQFANVPGGAGALRIWIVRPDSCTRLGTLAITGGHARIGLRVEDGGDCVEYADQFFEVVLAGADGVNEFGTRREE